MGSTTTGMHRFGLVVCVMLGLIMACVAWPDASYNFVKHFSEATIVEGQQIQAQQAFAGGIGKPALLQIPNEGGRAELRYSLALPTVAEGGFLLLHFYYSLADTASMVPPADGGELELRLGNVPVFHQKVTEQRWREAAIDVTRLGGQTVVFDFIALPGANAESDHLVWGQPRIYQLDGPPIPVELLAQGASLRADGGMTYTPPGEKDDWTAKLSCPVNQPGSLHLDLGPGASFSAGYLVAEYSVNLEMANLGDVPAIEVASLDASGAPLATARGASSPLQGGAAGDKLVALVPFNFGGVPFEKLSLGFNCEALDAPATPAPGRTITLRRISLFKAQPELAVKVLGVSPAVALAGEKVRFTCVIENEGTGNLDRGQTLTASLKLPDALASATAAPVTATDLLSGTSRKLTWELALPEGLLASDYPVGVSVMRGDAEVARGAATLRVFQAAAWPAPVAEGQPPQFVADGDLPATFANDKMAISFVRGKEGASGALLLVNQNGRFECMGSLYPLAKVGYKDGAGNLAWFNLPVTKVVKSVPQGNAVTLLLSGEATDSFGATWHLKYSLTLEAGSGQAGFGVSANCDKPTQLFAFYGPSLLAGDRSFGEAKQSAVFPGLEYLVGQEESSSTYAVAAPANERVSPHPFKVTLPLMWVTAQGFSVGLAWDPHLDYIPGRKYPLPIFASPNFVTGQENHLLSLFAPSLPERKTENKLWADEPLPWPVGATIRLAGSLFALTDPSGMEPARDWVARHMLPQPPTGGLSGPDLINACVNTFAKELWDPTSAGWRLAAAWPPEYDPELAAALLAYGLTAGKQELVDQSLAAAQAAGVPGLPLALLLGVDRASLESERDYVCALISSQREDGAWPFCPDARLQVFGASGDTATGLTAAVARKVLHYAVVSLDQTALASGLKALDWLSGQTRPEGGQSWESPLHTPDLLAAADLVKAFLTGYQITGAPEYLEQAKLWAARGLPFLYLWQADERPRMAYATVPMFGATWLDVQPWFGLASPWVGMQYADSLTDLARLDNSGPWRKLAEGILAFAAGLQIPAGEERAGLVPDAWDVVEGGKPYQFDLAPKTLLKLASNLAGRPLSADTRLVQMGSGRVSITVTGLVLSAECQADGCVAWKARRRGDIKETHLVAGLQPPTSVKVDGAAAQAGPASDSAPSWEYLEDFGLLMVHVPRGRGPVTVEVQASLR